MNADVQARREFEQYCQTLTNAQVLAVLAKEREACRESYATIALNEALKRGLEV